MDMIDLTILRDQIFEASAAAEQEILRRRVEHEKYRTEQFEKEKPEHRDRAEKVLAKLPGLIKEAKLYNSGDPWIRIMNVLVDDYDYDKIPWDEKRLPLSKIMEHINRHEGFNSHPYLTKSTYLKPHSAAALVLDACKHLGLNPSLEDTGISSSRDAGAAIYCHRP